MEDGRCNEKVYPPSTWGSFHGHQCTRKDWKDGYCKQHHPDSVAKRELKKEERWNKKQQNSPWNQLRIANKRIQELEELLKECNEDL